MPKQQNSQAVRKRLLFVNGPNLSLLGVRRPEIYGTTTLADIEIELKKILASDKETTVELQPFQSDVEGHLVTFFNQAYSDMRKHPELFLGIIFNPGAYAHTSIALRDALELFTEFKTPVVEVHLSNVYAREEFRHHSWLSPVVTATVSGLGAEGYLAAGRYILRGALFNGEKPR